MEKHFTATAFIQNSKNEVLLMWHKKLKRWMPPGGHIDPNESPAETAKRECKEETGLDIEIIGDQQEDIFRENRNEGRMLKKPVLMLLENIPENKERNEAAHMHMDFIYIGKMIDESQTLVLQEHEGDELRWFSKKDIKNLSSEWEIFANVKTYILSMLER